MSELIKAVLFLSFPFVLVLSFGIVWFRSQKKDTKAILAYFKNYDFEILKIKYSVRLELSKAGGRSYYSKALLYYSDNLMIVVPNKSFQSILTVDPRVFLFEDRDDRKQFPHIFKPEVSFTSWNALNIIIRRKHVTTSIYYISINLEDKTKFFLFDGLKRMNVKS